MLFNRLLTPLRLFARTVVNLFQVGERSLVTSPSKRGTPNGKPSSERLAEQDTPPDPDVVGELLNLHSPKFIQNCPFPTSASGDAGQNASTSLSPCYLINHLRMTSLNVRPGHPSIFNDDIQFVFWAAHSILLCPFQGHPHNLRPVLFHTRAAAATQTIGTITILRLTLRQV